MYFLDTAKDARILILEDALRRLESIFSKRLLRFQVDYNQLLNLLGAAKEAYYAIKYSYMEPHELRTSESLETLTNAIRKFESIYTTAKDERGFKPAKTSEKRLLAETEYVFRVVFGFRNRLSRPPNPAFAIDILCVEITQVSDVEQSDNLLACRCTDGSRIWRVHTNIDSVESGMRMAVGVLPPAELMGGVSEAMFLHRAPLHKDTTLGFLDKPPQEALDQAAAQVVNITKKVK